MFHIENEILLWNSKHSCCYLLQVINKLWRKNPANSWNLQQPNLLPPQSCTLSLLIMRFIGKYYNGHAVVLWKFWFPTDVEFLCKHSFTKFFYFYKCSKCCFLCIMLISVIIQNQIWMWVSHSKSVRRENRHPCTTLLRNSVFLILRPISNSPHFSTNLVPHGIEAYRELSVTWCLLLRNTTRQQQMKFWQEQSFVSYCHDNSAC